MTTEAVRSAAIETLVTIDELHQRLVVRGELETADVLGRSRSVIQSLLEGDEKEVRPVAA